MQRVFDEKPKVLKVFDEKPNALKVFDEKPTTDQLGVETNRLYQQILTAGMYMGIPPHTYSEAGTVNSPFSP